MTVGKALSFALGFEQGRGQRVLRVATAPNDELERRVKPVTFTHGHINQIFDLLVTDATNATQQQGMAEHQTKILRATIQNGRPKDASSSRPAAC